MDADEWDERYAATELVWSREPNRFVARECEDLEPGRAVDLAAGEGRNAIWLASRGWHVQAVDFSQAALDKGRRLTDDLSLPGAVEFVRADATTWAPAEPVDLVVIAYLQLPAAERRQALRHAAGSLAPGGTFLLVAHDSTNLTEGTGGPQDPDVLMSADDVLGDLEGLDLEVVHAGRVAREVSPDPASGPDHHEHGGEPRRTAWDCLVRMRRPG